MNFHIIKYYMLVYEHYNYHYLLPYNCTININNHTHYLIIP